MGVGPFVEKTVPQTPASRLARSIDMPLLVIVVALVVFGLVMLYSASWDFSRAAFDDPMYMFNRQVMWLGIGIVAAVALAFLDYHHWRRLIVPAMAFTIATLFIVLLMSELRFNARRTIFNGSIQPSELAKLISILYIAVWLYAKRDMLKDVTFGLIPLGVILGFVGGLIYQQPDLSAAATVLMLGGLLFFLAGGDLKQISGLLVIAGVVAWLVISVSLTGQQRMSDFLAGIKDPLQASYHVRRSFEAVVNGGWFGVGIGNSLTKVTGLPVPPTDSIYAVVIEELGWFGGVGLIVLFGALVWRGLVIARRAPDMLGTLIASGLVIWIGIEALINMAVMVGLLPFAGNALPFVSSGGSNLVTTLAALGILFNISRQGNATNVSDDEWRSFGAVANLRWGTGGGVYPALSVYEVLKSKYPNAETLWVGGEGGMEEDLVKRAGIPFRSVPAAGVHGVGLRALPGNLAKLTRGVLESRRILKDFKPDVLFFTGGYVAAPMALAGRDLPIVLYVPDIEPGLALKFLSYFADVITVTAPDSKKYFSHPERIIHTGYPLRSGLLNWSREKAVTHFGLDASLPTLLVTGGSKGARSINMAVTGQLNDLLEMAQIIHLTGTLDIETVQAAAEKLPAEKKSRYHVMPYLHEMGAALAAADLVVSRAGASSIGEYPFFGLPAVLTPYPYAWRYQKVNADYLAERNAAVILPDELLQDTLSTVIKDLLSNGNKQDAMKTAMKNLAQPHAAEDIAGQLVKLAGAQTL